MNGCAPGLTLIERLKVTRKWAIEGDNINASTRHHRARLRKYYPRRPCAPSFAKSRTFRLLIYSFLTFSATNILCPYVYTRGILECLLGFWPLGKNPAGAKTSKPYAILKCCVQGQCHVTLKFVSYFFDVRRVS